MQFGFVIENSNLNCVILIINNKICDLVTKLYLIKIHDWCINNNNKYATD